MLGRILKDLRDEVAFREASNSDSIECNLTEDNTVTKQVHEESTDSKHTDKCSPKATRVYRHCDQQR